MLLLFSKSESLECTKVVVLKLGAILSYSGIHFKPPKLRKKSLHQLLFFHQFQSKCAGDDSSWSECHMHHCHSA